MVGNEVCFQIMYIEYSKGAVYISKQTKMLFYSVARHTFDAINKLFLNFIDSVVL